MTADPRDSDISMDFQCVSTGALERLIAERVRAQVSGAAPAEGR